MSRYRGTTFVCACLIIVCSVKVGIVNAQSHEKKWGDISRKNLQMKVYAPDSSAAAVVLFDVGKITHDLKLDFYLDRHVRIKILSDQGFDWATVTVPYDKHDGQDVSRIDGQTYYLDGQGKIQKAKLDHKDIFKEKEDNGFESVKFTLPKVRPGSIIEYRYHKKIGDVSYIHSWTFQKDIPVEWSELDFHKPSMYDFKMMLRGELPLAEESNKFYSQIIDLSQLDRYDMSGPTQPFRLNGYIMHWAMKDIPALEDESHVDARDFYRSRMLLQYSSITIRDQFKSVIYHKDYLGTWQSLRDRLLEDPDFGHRLKSRVQFKSVLSGLLTDKMSELDKMQAIYDHVKKAIVWDKTDAMFCESNPKDVYKRKSGTSAEINFLLIQMLRDAGINAYPVIASTRDNGPILNIIPIYQQFNTTLCLATIGQKNYFLDATNPYRPFNQVPVRLEGAQGLVIETDPPPNADRLHWVEIKEKPQNERNVSITGSLSGDGLFSGTIGIRFNGYFGTEYRRDLDQAKSLREFVRKELLDQFQDVKIDTVSTLFQNNEVLPFMINIKLEGTIKTLQNGNISYIDPMVLFRREKNPFTQKTRTLPIDFPYPESLRYMFKVKLDSGLTVTSNDENVVRKAKSGGLIAQYIIKKDNGYLTVFSGINLSKIQFPARQYPELKDFFGQVVHDENTRVVLQKAQ